MKKFEIIILCIIVIMLGVVIGFAVYQGLDGKANNNANTTQNVEVVPIKKDEVKNEINKEDFVNKYKQVIQSYMNDMNKKIYACYALKDIDKDGVPELIIKDGYAEATTKYYIYSYVDGEAKLLDTLGGGHSVLYSTDDNYIVLFMGQMGYESIYNVYLENGKVSVDTIEDQVDKIESGYTEFSNEIEMVSYGDTTTIDNYSID